MTRCEDVGRADKTFVLDRCGLIRRGGAASGKCGVRYENPRSVTAWVCLYASKVNSGKHQLGSRDNNRSVHCTRESAKDRLRGLINSFQGTLNYAEGRSGLVMVSQVSVEVSEISGHVVNQTRFGIYRTHFAYKEQRVLTDIPNKYTVGWDTGVRRTHDTVFAIFSCGIAKTPLSHSCTGLQRAVIKWIPEFYSTKTSSSATWTRSGYGESGYSLRLS